MTSSVFFPGPLGSLGDPLKRYRDMGAARVVVTLPPETADKTLPVLD